MDKKTIEDMQWSLRMALLCVVVVIALVIGWAHLMTWLDVPRGPWQPASLIVVLFGGAYIVLEVMKRRRK